MTDKISFEQWYIELKSLFFYKLGQDIDEDEKEGFRSFYDLGYTPDMVLQYIKDQ